MAKPQTERDKAKVKNSVQPNPSDDTLLLKLLGKSDIITNENNLAGSAPKNVKSKNENLKIDFQKVSEGDLTRTSLQLLDGAYDLAKEAAKANGLNFTEFSRRAIFYAMKNPHVLTDDEVFELEKSYYFGLSNSRWNRKMP